ncbi:MAG: hypothetical protein HOC77_00015 [Chloroflexi bacterium]|nr:hypothetical protein [Chloroflexota bacterium]MBT4513459.1 hypothetical protein [Chloroflexota bacterium]MBT6680542.1 hypothetical protein [Chloroflexota bacterium]
MHLATRNGRNVTGSRFVTPIGSSNLLLNIANPGAKLDSPMLPVLRPGAGEAVRYKRQRASAVFAMKVDGHVAANH